MLRCIHLFLSITIKISQNHSPSDITPPIIPHILPHHLPSTQFPVSTLTTSYLLLPRYWSYFPVCSQMERGIFALIAPTSDPSYDTFAAYSNMFQMPLVSPAFPQQTSSDRPSNQGVSLRPRYLRAIVDVINYYTWKTIIYLYDSDNGMYYFALSGVWRGYDCEVYWFVDVQKLCLWHTWFSVILEVVF